MTVNDAISAASIGEMLQTVIDILGTKMNIITNPHVLQEARKNLSVISVAATGEQQWVLDIPRKKPLRFEKSRNARGARLIPALSCHMVGEEDSPSPPFISKIEMRLLSDEYPLIYRKEWDSSVIDDRLSQLNPMERVMFRCHFDIGESNKDGEPKYHLNYGGVAQDEELCWMPTSIRHPRIPFFPIDLVLACELLVANFFPREFLTLQKEPEWRALVYASEHTLLRSLLDECARRCNTEVSRRRVTNDETVFSSWWLIEPGS